jgi:hypothetical protein
MSGWVALRMWPRSSAVAEKLKMLNITDILESSIGEVKESKVNRQSKVPS